MAALAVTPWPRSQQVRASPARLKCSNNFKQIGIAMPIDNDTDNKLPTGWVTAPAPSTTAPSPSWSWATVVLPYLEQANLYTQLNVDLSGNVGSTVIPLTQTKLAGYRCPSDSGADLAQYFQNFGASNSVVNREVTGPGRTDGNNNI